MGLACSQIRLLSLTERKADLEYGISIASMEKIALAKEQSNLTAIYNSKLKATQLCYFQNGQYSKINYSYLMSDGSVNGAYNLIKGFVSQKARNDMILADCTGKVVLDKSYADAISSVLGSDAINNNLQGKPFSLSYVPEILLKLGAFAGINKTQIENVMNGGEIESSYGADIIWTLTGETVGQKDVDNSPKATELVKKLIDFYLPIIRAAAANGWTTQYNSQIENNNDYISDALMNGTFQLTLVDDYGDYENDTSLSYFKISGDVLEKSDADKREEVTAWYMAEKDKVSEKESFLDLEITEMSTELEAIKVEMQSLKSIIKDETEKFNMSS